MNFVADESVDQQIVHRLRNDGHEVLSVSETEPGKSDNDVLSLARSLNALLITADKDFGELVFRQHLLTSGVILLRLSGVSASRKATFVSSAVSEHSSDLPDAFTVVSRGITRVRRRLGSRRP